MKTITLVISVFIMFALYSFDAKSVKIVSDKTREIVKMPKNVEAIINKSCYMCHNSESQNVKGKLKLKFESFEDGSYKTSKQIAKYMEIAEVVSEAKMPPSKFLEKHPEKSINAEEKTILEAWAKDMAKTLSGE